MIYTEKYEKEADKYWDKFYKKNNANFFKDRHWLVREFPEFLAKPEKEGDYIEVLEIGCGVGNTTLPLLGLNDRLRFYSFDFSEHAVGLLAKEVEANESFRGRCLSFVGNAVGGSADLPASVPRGQIDLVVIIFVLSAMDPSTLPAVVDSCLQCLRPGGKVLIRDYAENDMAQTRFERHSSKLGDNFHVRCDGTRAFYFSLEFMEKLFTDGGHFEVDQNIFVEKKVVNRRQQNEMDRKFIQSKFIKKGLPNNCSTSSSNCFADHLDRMNWAIILDGPIPPTFASTLIGKTIYIFGGGDGNKALNDMYSLDTETFVWTHVKTTGSVPRGRGYHSSILLNGKIGLLGGSDGELFFSDFHLFDPANNSWSILDVKNTSPVLSHSLFTIGKKVFVFGGHNGNEYINLLKELHVDKLEWEEKSVTGNMYQFIRDLLPSKANEKKQQDQIEDMSDTVNEAKQDVSDVQEMEFELSMAINKTSTTIDRLEEQRDELLNKVALVEKTLSDMSKSNLNESQRTKMEELEKFANGDVKKSIENFDKEIDNLTRHLLNLNDKVLAQDGVEDIAKLPVKSEDMNVMGADTKDNADLEEGHVKEV
eukprot:gene8039-9443_t